MILAQGISGARTTYQGLGRSSDQILAQGISGARTTLAQPSNLLHLILAQGISGARTTCLSGCVFSNWILAQGISGARTTTVRCWYTLHFDFSPIFTTRIRRKRSKYADFRKINLPFLWKHLHWGRH